MEKRTGIAALLALSLFGSFFSTLWLTEPPIANAPPIKDDSGPVAERLAARQILNNADLITAAKSIGLYQSERMGGNVDAITRINERDVREMGGRPTRTEMQPRSAFWYLLEAYWSRRPKRKESAPMSRGRFSLFFGSEKNVSYSVSFACRPATSPSSPPLVREGIFRLNSPVRVPRTRICRNSKMPARSAA